MVQAAPVSRHDFSTSSAKERLSSTTSITVQVCCCSAFQVDEILGIVVMKAFSVTRSY